MSSVLLSIDANSSLTFCKTVILLRDMSNNNILGPRALKRQRTDTDLDDAGGEDVIKKDGEDVEMEGYTSAEQMKDEIASLEEKLAARTAEVDHIHKLAASDKEEVCHRW